VLPASLESSAICGANGEFAWHRSAAIDAMEVLVHSNLAILGGELWLVEGERINTAPHLRSGLAAVARWVTDDMRRGELWTDYVDRTAEQTRRTIQDFEEWHERVDIPSSAEVYYNISFATETEIRELRARRAHPGVRYGLWIALFLSIGVILGSEFLGLFMGFDQLAWATGLVVSGLGLIVAYALESIDNRDPLQLRRRHGSQRERA
jgi:hypothetical protein